MSGGFSPIASLWIQALAPKTRELACKTFWNIAIYRNENIMRNISSLIHALDTITSYNLQQLAAYNGRGRQSVVLLRGEPAGPHMAPGAQQQGLYLWSTSHGKWKEQT